MGFLLSDAPRKPLGTADESKLTRAETGAKIKQLQHALRRLPSLRAKMQESGDLFDQLVHHPEVSLPSAFLAEAISAFRFTAITIAEVPLWKITRSGGLNFSRLRGATSTSAMRWGYTCPTASMPCWATRQTMLTGRSSRAAWSIRIKNATTQPTAKTPAKLAKV